MILKEVSPGIHRIKDFSVLGIIVPIIITIAGIVWFLNIPFDSSNFESYMPFALIIGGIASLFFWKGIITTVDQNQQIIQFKLFKLYKKEEKTKSFTDVTSVKYEETLRTSMNRRRGHSTTRQRSVKINLKDNEITVYRSNSSAGIANMALTNYVKQDAKKLADVLSVQLIDNSMQGGIMNFAQSFTNTTNSFNPNQEINHNTQQNNNEEKRI